MKIASKIHPRNGQVRNVNIHGHSYAFTHFLDNDDAPHFVADVKSADHAAVLLGTGDFYQLGDKQLPKPTLTPAPPAPPAKPIEADAEVLAEATALLAGSAAKIAVDVAKVSTPEVVRVALATEKASPDARKNVQAILQSTLDGIVAAGVKG